ncbi:membrane protein [Rhodococcoides trifolii]|uniref:Membrane protein n=1 Tax=Rhodococcoides trifolii TaxID=908250 RepID=A0A917G0W8_9NOCA|nr:DMT family transporter [Rhodococcus trifolii]GGG17157.1 membrane protein [Rhodococcus trifolii]
MARQHTGLLFAALAAVAFGVSGPFAKALTESGWSPEAAVFVRVVGGAVVLVPFVLIARRHAFSVLKRRVGSVLFYGVAAVAGAQVAFFNAIQHLSVGVALLLEYLAPVLVIGWVWITSRRRPTTGTLIGAAIALAGAAIVLDVGNGAEFDLVGVLWGLLAALCLTVYFVVSASDGDPVDPFVLTAAGLSIGGITVGGLAALGVVSLRFSGDPVEVSGHEMSWLVPAVVLAVVSAALAYIFGIVGSRMLGAGTASVVALVEVVCAVVAAFLLLGESITMVQLCGGVAILGGVALVQRSSSADAPVPSDVVVATSH